MMAYDAWLLSEDVKPGAVDELYAVVNMRTRAKKSTIVCAQYHVKDWPKRMGDYPAAESIVGRLKNSAYKVEIKSEISMRERCTSPSRRALPRIRFRDEHGQPEAPGEDGHASSRMTTGTEGVVIL